MGLDARFTLLPLAILIVSIVMSGLTTATGLPGVFYNGNCGNNCNVALDAQPGGNATTISCGAYQYTVLTQNPCFSSTSPNGLFSSFTGIITCPTGQTNGCYVSAGCPSSFQASGGLFCNPFLNILVCEAGCIATINSGTGTGKVAYANPITLVFNTITGPDGFITWIGIAIFAAVVLGITFLGSSATNTESLHDFLIGGGLLGLWLFFSAIEGFITGASYSFFTQLNAFLSGMGSGFYFILTLLYFVGVLKALDRGL